MKWGKLGIVIRPLGAGQALSHCYVPTPLVIEEKGIIRVFYSSWDENQRGRIFYSDLDIEDPTKEIKQSQKPVIGLGSPGTFDSDGVSPQCALMGSNGINLLYQGFQRTSYPKINMMLTGLATQTPSGGLRRWAETPFLERTPTEPYIRSAPFMIVGGGFFQMWYTSGISGWEECENKTHWDTYPRYDISFILGKSMSELYKATSARCYLKKPDELGVAKPWVLYENKIFKMWFSYRKEDMPYQMGYAESTDGLTWERKDDQIGLTPGNVYDNEMVCFGAVFDVGNNRYMLYNGNDHGRYGAVLAILEQD